MELKKTKMGPFMLLALLFLPVIALATETCYLQINFKEIRSETNPKIVPLEISLAYGDYRGLVIPYSPDTPYSYLLDVYDNNGQLISIYPVQSSLNLYYSAIDQSGVEGGGVFELETGFNSLMIPYNEQISSIKFRLTDGEVAIPIDKDLTCEVTCKQENEGGTYGLDKCCSGLIPSTQSSKSFVCINCGDGICSPNEDEYSCFEDCKPGNIGTSPENAILDTGRPEPDTPSLDYPIQPISIINGQNIEDNDSILFAVLIIFTVTIATIVLFVIMNIRKKPKRPRAQPSNS
jgi:hypothetical protein